MQPFVEQLDTDPDTSFLCRRFVLPSFPFNWHMHREVELTWIERGAGERFVGDSIERFGPGDLVLIGGNVPHTWASSPAGPGGGQRRRACESIVIQFDPQRLAGGFLDSPEAAPLRRLLRRSLRGLRFGSALSREVGEAMRRMAHEQRPLDRSLTLLDLLARLAAGRSTPLSSAPVADAADSAEVARIDTVLRWLESHLEEPMSVADAAAQTGLSESAFSRFFRRSTGNSFVNYVHRRRIARACQLLQDTDYPITEIAFRSGFANLSHFNRVFLRQTRLTPRSYRKSFRE